MGEFLLLGRSACAGAFLGMLSFFSRAGRTSVTQMVNGRDLEVALAFLFFAFFGFACLVFLFSDFRAALGPGPMQTDLVSHVLAQVVKAADFNLLLAALELVSAFAIWAAETAGEHGSACALLGSRFFLCCLVCGACLAIAGSAGVLCRGQER